MAASSFSTSTAIESPALLAIETAVSFFHLELYLHSFPLEYLLKNILQIDVCIIFRLSCNTALKACPETTYRYQPLIVVQARKVCHFGAFPL